MKVAVVYIRVVSKYQYPLWVGPLPYEPSTERFLTTYLKFKPKIPHDLIVVDCGATHTDTIFDGIACAYERYDGGGYDCGAYQVVVKKLNHDLVLCLNTHAYLWTDAWLERFVCVFEKYGHGIYGSSGSFEEHPHIRTPAIAFSPAVIKDFPETVDTREKCCLFECGPRNFTLYSMSRGFPVRIVAGDGDYHLYDSDKINNGFRHGDQSNVLIRDRHTDVWDKVSPDEKRLYTQVARTLKNGFPDSRLRQ